MKTSGGKVFSKLSRQSGDESKISIWKENSGSARVGISDPGAFIPL